MVSKNLRNFTFLIIMLILASNIFSTQEQIRVEFREYVNQSVLYNPLKSGTGVWFDTNENQTNYSLMGEIVISNQRPNNESVSDIYVSIGSVGNISLPTYKEGRSGSFISSNLSSGLLILYIPELNANENSTWSYVINHTQIQPPLNLYTNYSFPKILAGDNLSINDTLRNEFVNASDQNSTCIYDINLTQTTIPVNFSGLLYNITFDSTSTNGSDSGNVSYASNNQTQFWNVLGGNCLNQNSTTNINYSISPPSNFPTSAHYRITNTTLTYNLNSTISYLRLVDITAISRADIGFEKNIEGPTFISSPDFNVTWNVTGFFNSTSNISYELREVTLWVSQRNVNGSYTDPNTIDNDTVTNTALNITYTPFQIVNGTNPWTSSGWTFNYTDIPSPIVWMETNFTILNDGVQLINRSITRNENDFFIKELYVIVGYWLEINKNVTAINNNSYTIEINVRNKGNSATPENAIVTVYDFVPNNYNFSSGFTYSDPVGGWYTTASANSSIVGPFNGTLIQWALIPTTNGGLNSSLDGRVGSFNENNTWSVTYNVTGFGEYRVMDVYVAGLDPQKVDGAGTSEKVEVLQRLDMSSNIERVLAIFAGALVVIGLLI